MLPDGEYDIDLSVLGYENETATSNGPLALRYGFVPDSMSQKEPLKLYRDDQTCVLEAQLSLQKGKAPTVIFEGIQQRQRAGASGSGPDSFYLAFEKDPKGAVKVLLQQLSNTIRMSKSRNADKWRTAIAEWQKAPKDGIYIPEVKAQQQQAATGPTKTNGEVKKPMKKPTKKAAKRPPTATPDKEIINMEDFEDLESESETSNLMTGSALKEVEKPKPKPRTAKRAKKDGDVDMDDDFKDLEDQLQEVLESSESLPNAFGENFSESDEDDDDGGARERIVIKMADEPEPEKKSFGRNGLDAKQGKPMSLRELYGDSKNDEFSSSEEE
ncbi:hypothetical protein C7M61_004262 [Candidozyma pseudohaemuli]|uniref:Transcription elongation factor Eaf N-terminal domain-containing protein n=1 Tax=Candidozyma pseudohaemuli TaxID=418784 RepID=A0A2P7YII6_9ASCO|nr:hypothetical protein C7M61_004262 [[Candida] pseudohaemulonii]PSK35781.1 hypothetical protein C7M61_004262 [[Candida] pseudohaemulonii]